MGCGLGAVIVTVVMALLAMTSLFASMGFFIPKANNASNYLEAECILREASVYQDRCCRSGDHCNERLTDCCSEVCDDDRWDPCYTCYLSLEAHVPKQSVEHYDKHDVDPNDSSTLILKGRLYWPEDGKGEDTPENMIKQCQPFTSVKSKNPNGTVPCWYSPTQSYDEDPAHFLVTLEIPIGIVVWFWLSVGLCGFFWVVAPAALYIGYRCCYKEEETPESAASASARNVEKGKTLSDGLGASSVSSEENDDSPKVKRKKQSKEHLPPSYDDVTRERDDSQKE